MAKVLSLFELQEMFPDEEAARTYIERHRWPEGVCCAGCGTDSVYARTGKRAGEYNCRKCGKVFSVRTDSALGRSKAPLRKWICAMHLMVNSRKCISALHLSEEIQGRLSHCPFHAAPHPRSLRRRQ